MVSRTEREPFLFTLRIWVEPGDGNLQEWRGKLQSLPDGEAYYFSGWPVLVERLEAMVKARDAAGDHFPPHSKGEKS
jgi:hypothetical protein